MYSETLRYISVKPKTTYYSNNYYMQLRWEVEDIFLAVTYCVVQKCCIKIWVCLHKILFKGVYYVLFEVENWLILSIADASKNRAIVT